MSEKEGANGEDIEYGKYKSKNDGKFWIKKNWKKKDFCRKMSNIIWQSFASPVMKLPSYKYSS